MSSKIRSTIRWKPPSCGFSGIQFVLLAGGGPLIRQDVLAEAAQFGSILFPVFSNGTLIDQAFCGFLDKHRNLVPVLSMEGGRD